MHGVRCAVAWEADANMGGGRHDLANNWVWRYGVGRTCLCALGLAFLGGSLDHVPSNGHVAAEKLYLWDHVVALGVCSISYVYRKACL